MVEERRVGDYIHQMGWVRISLKESFYKALWHVTCLFLQSISKITVVGRREIGQWRAWEEYWKQVFRGLRRKNLIWIFNWRKELLAAARGQRAGEKRLVGTSIMENILILSPNILFRNKDIAWPSAAHIVSVSGSTTNASTDKLLQPIDITKMRCLMVRSSDPLRYTKP